MPASSSILVNSWPLYPTKGVQAFSSASPQASPTMAILAFIACYPYSRFSKKVFDLIFVQSVIRTLTFNRDAEDRASIYFYECYKHPVLHCWLLLHAGYARHPREHGRAVLARLMSHGDDQLIAWGLFDSLVIGHIVVLLQPTGFDHIL